MSGPAGDNTTIPSIVGGGPQDLLKRATQAMMSRYVVDCYYVLLTAPFFFFFLPIPIAGNAWNTTSHRSDSSTLLPLLPPVYPRLLVVAALFFTPPRVWALLLATSLSLAIPHYRLPADRGLFTWDQLAPNSTWQSDTGRPRLRCPRPKLAFEGHLSSDGLLGPKQPSGNIDGVGRLSSYHCPCPVTPGLSKPLPLASSTSFQAEGVHHPSNFERG
jgi:hypothetical protein